MNMALRSLVYDNPRHKEHGDGVTQRVHPACYLRARSLKVSKEMMPRQAALDPIY